MAGEFGRRSRDAFGGRTGALVLLVLALLAAPPFAAQLHGTARFPSAESARAVPLASGGTPPLVNNGAIFINDTGPTGTAAIGSRLTVSYEFSVPGYPNGSPAAQLRIPSVLASFPTSSGPFRLYLPPANLSVAPGGQVGPRVNTTTRLSSTTHFNATGLPSLQSQGFALLASWPFGAHTVQAQWGWTIVSPDGSTVVGPSSKKTSVAPGEIALVARAPPASVALGGSYPLCLSGPIAGRTFSVHFSTVSPFATYSAPSATASTLTAGEFCWNSTVSSSLPLGPAFVHLWEYAAGTYLLYQFSAQLNGAPNSSSPPPVGGGKFPSTAVVTIGAVVALASGGLGIIYRTHTRSPRGFAQSPSTWDALPAASSPSARDASPGPRSPAPPQPQYTWRP